MTEEDKNMVQKMTRIFLSGEVNETMYGELTTKLEPHLDNCPHSPLTIYINSAGGDPETGLGIYDLLRSLPTPIYTVANGKAQSSAFLILLGAHKIEHRFCTPHTRFMLHKGVQKDLPLSTDKEMEVFGTEMREINNAMMRIVAQDCTLSSRQVRMRFFNNIAPVFFSAVKAREYGFISKIINHVHPRIVPSTKR